MLTHDATHIWFRESAARVAIKIVPATLWRSPVLACRYPEPHERAICR